MRILPRLFLAAAMLTVSWGTASSAQAADYTIDTAHSSLNFTVRHLATNVRGQFRTFEGAFTFDPSDLKRTSGTLTAETASLDTNHGRRDEHLRSGDFFEVETYPNMTYVFTGAKKKGKDYVIDGELTIRNVTKKVPLTVKQLGVMVDPWGNETTSFSGTATLDRKDFGLNWNKALEAGGLMVGDEVKIEVNIAAHPKKDEEKEAKK